jgi:peptidoglycan hydrolase-like protein with peptidoglycan-binding domain
MKKIIGVLLVTTFAFTWFLTGDANSINKPVKISHSSATNLPPETTRNISKKHDSIASLQEKLTHLGYKPGKTDGIIGKKTISAIKDFQRTEKLPVSGQFDRSTKKMLSKRTQGFRGYAELTRPAKVQRVTQCSYGRVKQVERSALVIGNARYKQGAELKNPVRDAKAIAKSLEELGFSVYHGYDLNYAQMQDRINCFTESLKEDGVAVVYYAGHGVEENGKNLLIPLNSVKRADKEVVFKRDSAGRKQVIRLQDDLMDKMKQTKSKYHIVMLDACRENIKMRSLIKTVSSLSRGFSRVNSASNKRTQTLIAFATAPGQLAYDGVGKHSYFAKALIRHIKTPELSLTGLFREVSRDVITETDNDQMPWVNSSVTEEFYFVGSNIKEIRQWNNPLNYKKHHPIDNKKIHISKKDQIKISIIQNKELFKLGQYNGDINKLREKRLNRLNNKYFYEKNDFFR